MKFSGIAEKNIRLDYKHLITEPAFAVLDKFVISAEKQGLALESI